MRYFLLRQAPKSLQEHTIMSMSIAMKWDVVMILKSSSPMITPSILYHSNSTGTVYVHQVDKLTFDLMDAFDMPHAIRKDFSVVVPQQVFTPNSDIAVRAVERSRITYIATRRSPHHILSGIVTFDIHKKMGRA